MMQVIAYDDHPAFLLSSNLNSARPSSLTLLCEAKCVGSLYIFLNLQYQSNTHNILSASRIHSANSLSAPYSNSSSASYSASAAEALSSSSTLSTSSTSDIVPASMSFVGVILSIADKCWYVQVKRANRAPLLIATVKDETLLSTNFYKIQIRLSSDADGKKKLDLVVDGHSFFTQLPLPLVANAHTPKSDLNSSSELSTMSRADSSALASPSSCVAWPAFGVGVWKSRATIRNWTILDERGCAVSTFPSLSKQTPVLAHTPAMSIPVSERSAQLFGKFEGFAGAGVGAEELQPSKNNFTDSANNSQQSLTIISSASTLVLPKLAGNGNTQLGRPQTFSQRTVSMPQLLPSAAATTSNSLSSSPTLSSFAVRPRFTSEVYSNDLIDLIESTIIDRDLGVSFDDIAALTDAKRVLQEAIIMPLLFPHLFTGIRSPVKGVLLHGPAGTGKTMLAKAVASVSETSFFNVNGAVLTSKWRGESEKLCSCLFAMAKHYAPSIIFLDEIDALFLQRGQHTEHEASRALKAVMFQLIDGVLSTTPTPTPAPVLSSECVSTSPNSLQCVADEKENANVMTVTAPHPLILLLATSNCPWDLDCAIRRRLEKRIYVPLPDAQARQQLFQQYVRGVHLAASVDLQVLAVRTETYSGADIKAVCRDAAMAPVRRLMGNQDMQQLLKSAQDGVGGRELETKMDAVTMQDFNLALQRIQPSVNVNDIQRYENWQKEFGSL